MCIIVCKEKGVKLPSKETFQQCFKCNSDGAGLMWYNPYKKKVIIDKGYMSFESFWKHIEHLQRKYDLDSLAMVFHFRIGTDGVRQNPANTHPFAIKRELATLTKTYLETDVGVAHNGIIRYYPGDKVYSDTQYFISTYLFDLYKTNPRFYKNVNMQKAIRLLTSSKFAFLDDMGTITRIGNFEEKDGVYYSNSTYIVWTGCMDEYDYYPCKYDDYEYNTYNYETYAWNKKSTKTDTFKKVLIPNGYYVMTDSDEFTVDDIYYVNQYGTLFDKDNSYIGWDTCILTNEGTVWDYVEVIKNS